mmetsp:Transcript_27910/g.76174  ORF Transcript_27910/g.76174 Transcript_27910/m.76174 type:complete len:82 (-) Transcript_27910:162-407(-)
MEFVVRGKVNQSPFLGTRETGFALPPPLTALPALAHTSFRREPTGRSLSRVETPTDRSLSQRSIDPFPSSFLVLPLRYPLF